LVSYAISSKLKVLRLLKNALLFIFSATLIIAANKLGASWKRLLFLFPILLSSSNFYSSPLAEGVIAELIIAILF